MILILKAIHYFWLIFRNFSKMYLKIRQSDPAKFLSYVRLAWKVALTKAELKLGLLTNIDMLLMVEKGIGGEKM